MTDQQKNAIVDLINRFDAQVQPTIPWLARNQYDEAIAAAKADPTNTFNVISSWLVAWSNEIGGWKHAGWAQPDTNTLLEHAAAQLDIPPRHTEPENCPNQPAGLDQPPEDNSIHIIDDPAGHPIMKDGNERIKEQWNNPNG